MFTNHLKEAVKEFNSNINVPAFGEVKIKLKDDRIVHVSVSQGYNEENNMLGESIYNPSLADN